MLLLSPICGEVLVLDFSSEVEKNRMYMCLFIYLFILKNWLMKSWRFGKSKMCRVGQQAGDLQQS